MAEKQIVHLFEKYKLHFKYLKLNVLNVKPNHIIEIIKIICSGVIDIKIVYVVL